MMFWFIGGATGSVIIGVLYFVLAAKTSTLLLRATTSAYAPAGALLFYVSVLVIPSESWQALGRSAFALSQLVLLPLFVHSLSAYPGKRTVHLVLVPLALICWLWQIGIGTMSIYGK